MKISTPPDQAIKFKSWQRETKAEIAKSMGRGKQGYLWAREVEHQPCAELADSSTDFINSDVRLLAAVNKAVKTGNAATRIAIATDEADQRGEKMEHSFQQLVYHEKDHP